MELRLGQRRVRPGRRRAAPRRRAAESRLPGGDPAAPWPARHVPHPGPRAARGDAPRARTAREGWAEGQPGLRPARGRQNFPASRLPHPDHESATVGKINFNFGSAAPVAP